MAADEHAHPSRNPRAVASAATLVGALALLSASRRPGSCHGLAGGPT